MGAKVADTPACLDIKNLYQHEFIRPRRKVVWYLVPLVVLDLGSWAFCHRVDAVSRHRFVQDEEGVDLGLVVGEGLV